MTLCPYCHKPAELVVGNVIYPGRTDLAGLMFHRCAPCDAYVGCHRAGAYVFTKGRKLISDGTLALGRLADARLRKAKQQAHAAFDPLWANAADKGPARRAAYKKLASSLDIPMGDCHIGDFDLEQCQRVVCICKGIARAAAEIGSQS